MNDFTQYQLLSVCRKLDGLNEIKLADRTLKVFGLAMGPKQREEVVFKVLKSLFYVHKGRKPEITLRIELTGKVTDIKGALYLSRWHLFLLNESKEKKELASDIQKDVFPGDEDLPCLNSGANRNYFINEERFSEFLVHTMTLSPINSFGIKKLVLEALDNTESELCQHKRTPKTLMKLFEAFNLTRNQRDIFLMYLLYETSGTFENFVNHTALDIYDRKKAPSALSKLLDLSLNEVKRELRPSSQLIQSLLLDIDKYNIEITDHISEYIYNDNEEGNIFDHLYEVSNTKEALEVKQHRLDETDLRVFKQLINSGKGANFLLHGRPGTGKTEFTKSLGRELGLDVYTIKTHDSETDNLLKQKKSGLIAAQTSLPRNSILVVDEAEQILSSGLNIFSRDKTDHKAWLNTFMEEHSVNIIWITNELYIHPSTKRRFDYAIQFDSFNLEQRVAAINNIQNKAGVKLFSTQEIESLSKNYTLDPGALGLSFKRISSVKIGKEEKKGLVKAMLDSQMRLINKDRTSEKPLESFYDPKFVNTSIEESNICLTLNQYYENPGKIRNLCMLFQGLPGTGKTEYAKHLSETLQRTMSVQRASDILSKYIGESEQNIARIFKEAEQNEEMLFIDECDSLFVSRSSAERSWEISQTNELLTQMERFKGVLICATNFLENLDKATLRRFHLKVRFDDLLPANLPHVFYAFFKKELSQREVSELVSIKSLNPGDFKAVYNSTVFMKDISNNELINRLKEEVSYKKTANPIGLK